MKSESVHITSAEQYAVVAAECCPNIHVHFISKSDIQEVQPFLEARWKNVVAVPRTRQMHCFTASGSDKLMVADTSNSPQFVSGKSMTEKMRRMRVTVKKKRNIQRVRKSLKHRPPHLKF